MDAMRDSSQLRHWFIVFAIGAAWPFVVNLFLVELQATVAPEVARAVLRSGFSVDYYAYATSTRVLNGLVVIALIGLIFGIPLGIVAERPWPAWLAFAFTALGASFIWHMSHKWGAEGFVLEWSLPEMWLALLCVGLVCALLHRLMRKSVAPRASAP